MQYYAKQHLQSSSAHIFCRCAPAACSYCGPQHCGSRTAAAVNSAGCRSRWVWAESWCLIGPSSCPQPDTVAVDSCPHLTVPETDKDRWIHDQNHDVRNFIYELFIISNSSNKSKTVKVSHAGSDVQYVKRTLHSPLMVFWNRSVQSSRQTCCWRPDLEKTNDLNS